MTRHHIIIACVAIVLFVPFLGDVRLFDWDEINFAENAREMIETGDYLHMQIDYHPFYEKPPLFIWLQVLSMKVFGVNAFAARFPNAIIGVITLLVVFNIGSLLYGSRFGLLWVLAYGGSLLPHFYFRSGIIDPLFNLFIFLGVWALLHHRGLLGGVWVGLAIMTKGPVGYLLVMLTTAIASIALRKKYALPWKQVLTSTAVAAVIPALWFGIDYLQNGPAFILENIHYQWRLLTTGEAGHEQPWYYHPVVVMIGCFPASVFFLGAMRRSDAETDSQQRMRIWMTVLFFVVLVLFSVVKTKIIHYSSMTYLPLTFLAAVYLHRWLLGGKTFPRPVTVGVVLLSTTLSALLVFVPLVLMNKQWLYSLSTFRDVYLRSALQQDVAIPSVAPFIGVILLSSTVVALLLQRGNHRETSVAVLFGGVALVVFLFLPILAPSIERYSQGSALDFYESVRGKQVYVKPLTMKSYAHLFYTNKPPTLSGASRGISADAWEPWLLSGAADHPVYFVAKVTDADQWKADGRLRVIKEEGGFVFFSLSYLPAGSAAP